MRRNLRKSWRKFWQWLVLSIPQLALHALNLLLFIILLLFFFFGISCFSNSLTFSCTFNSFVLNLRSFFLNAINSELKHHCQIVWCDCCNSFIWATDFIVSSHIELPAYLRMRKYYKTKTRTGSNITKSVLLSLGEHCFIHVKNEVRVIVCFLSLLGITSVE